MLILLLIYLENIRVTYKSIVSIWWLHKIKRWSSQIKPSIH